MADVPEIDFTGDTKDTPEGTTTEEIKAAAKADARKEFSWYERFVLRKVLSSIRRHLLRKHDKKRRPEAIKIITNAQEFMFIGPDGSDEEYTKEQLKTLPIEELERVLAQLMQELEAIL